MKDSLLLKWGTFKGWDLKSEAALQAARAYLDTGEHSLGSMQQRDTPEQKAALCKLIDAIDGTIRNDWSGKIMTKEEAKRYVMEYDQNPLLAFPKDWTWPVDADGNGLLFGQLSPEDQRIAMARAVSRFKDKKAAAAQVTGYLAKAGA